MSGAEWLWLGRYLLVILGAFMAGWELRGWLFP